MKYIIKYTNTKNHNLNNKLFIYDFGNIKGFLYNDNFIMYKIIERCETEEKVELYNEIVPKIAFSVEEYDCKLENDTYKLQDFDIVVKSFLSAHSEPFQPQQEKNFQQPPLPPRQKKSDYKKKNNLIKNEVYLNEASMKEQQEVRQKQQALMYPNVVKPQWTSLNQLMKGPLSLIDQELQKQQKQLKQRSHPLTPKNSFS